MLKDPNSLIAAATRIYGSARKPKPFALIETVSRVKSGEDPVVLAREIGSTRKKILEVAHAEDPIRAAFKFDLTAAGAADTLARVRRGIGQMLVGTLAERCFETTYRSVVQTDELRLEDNRSGRTDTDYRVFNGQDRPVFRINIKFHGSAFRNALELVGLSPCDCFALATYKIHSATTKQQREFLPYLFVVVSVPGLTGDSAGAEVPEDLVHLTSLYKGSSQPGKLGFEDLVVQHVIENRQDASLASAINSIRGRIAKAPWKVISARRANKLLHELLFERVYAVRVRGFASSYRRAEVDMHFSISEDLTSLDQMLELLRDHGTQGLTARLERGDL